SSHPPGPRRRLLTFPTRRASDLEIDVGVDEVGRERERAPIMRHRVIQLAIYREYVREVMVCFGVVWFELQRSTELRLAFLHSAQALERVAEIVVGQRVARIELNHPPVLRRRLV